jgi:hypothetical protein
MLTLSSEQLQREIQAAALKAIELFRKDFPNVEVCGFSLYSDADARSLAPAFNTKDHLARVQAENPEDRLYFKWSHAEWSHEAFGGHYFADLSKTLWSMADATSRDHFEQHRRQVFEICVAAMQTLTGSTFEHAIQVFSVAGFESTHEEIAWICALNTPEQAGEFKSWLEQHADG